MKKRISTVILLLVLAAMIGMILSMFVSGWYLWLGTYDGDAVYFWMSLLFVIWLPLGLGGEIILSVIGGWDEALDSLFS